MARKAPIMASKAKITSKTKVEPAPAPGFLTPDLPAPEVIVVRSGRIACDGVGGALGHLAGDDLAYLLLRGGKLGLDEVETLLGAAEHRAAA